MDDLAEDLLNIKAGKELTFVRPHLRIPEAGEPVRRPKIEVMEESEVQERRLFPRTTKVDEKEVSGVVITPKHLLIALSSIAVFVLSVILVAFIAANLSDWIDVHPMETGAAAPLSIWSKLADPSKPFVDANQQAGNDKIIFSFPPSVPIGNIAEIIGGEEGLQYPAEGDVIFYKNSRLHFYPNHICRAHPDLFRRFSANDLFAVTFDESSMSNEDPGLLSYLTHLSGLKWLYIERAKLCGANISALNGLDFKYLSLSNVDIDGRDISKLSKLQSLQGIELVSMASTRDFLRQLSGSKALQQLTIKYCTIDASMIMTIANISNLRELVLCGDTISEDSLAPLTKLRSLRKVTITDCGSMPGVFKLFARAKSHASILFSQPAGENDQAKDTNHDAIPGDTVKRAFQRKSTLDSFEIKSDGVKNELPPL